MSKAVSIFWVFIGAVIFMAFVAFYSYYIGEKNQKAVNLVSSYKTEQKLAEGDAKNVHKVLSKLSTCDIYCQWMQYATRSN